MFGFFNARFVEAVRLTMLVAALGFFLYGCTGRNPEKAFDKGDYLTAARLWLDRAERGDRTSLCPMIAALNVIHNAAKVQALWDRLSKLVKASDLNQQGQDKVAVDELLLGCSPSYYRRAADAGNPHAQYLLSQLPEEESQAEHLLELAAKNGSAEAQFAVGSRHDRDPSVKVYWWKLAAAQGYGLAQYALSQLYREGVGVPQDFEAAVKLLAQDAQQGSFLAQFELGQMYEKGEGVTQDFVQAHFWFNVAGAKALTKYDGNRANYARDSIAKKMTSDQIAAAQRLARDWRALPSPYF